MSTNTRSILRYPGSKARFVGLIEESIRRNKLAVEVFAEPFCGGASVSIALLEKGIVQSIALNDADPLIAHLWDTIFSIHNEWLAEQVITVPLTIDEWRRQKALEPSSPREAALKGLYLNRTSFNGILHKAGPLGGWGQEKRQVGVRFNREKLATRIRELAQLSDRVVAVSCNDWRTFCKRIQREFSAFFYFDPPYYHKADALYGYYFNEAEHEELRDYLARLEEPWMLSYDDAPEIRELYDFKSTFVPRVVVDSTYSTHPVGGASFVGRELFFTNLKRLPKPEDNDAPHIGLSIKKFSSKTKPTDDNGLTRIPFTAAAQQRSA